MSSYTIHRSEKSPENPYAQISRKMAQDSRLSFQARGLMLYILSKPPQWKGKSADLQREGNIKEKALKTMIDELILRGYIVRSETRKRGRFDYKLEVFEEPELNALQASSEECLTVPPSRGGGTDPPPRLPREVGSAIDSTGARAFSSITKREEVKKPRAQGYKQFVPPVYSISEVQDPSIFIDTGIMDLMVSLHPSLPFGDYFHKWWLSRKANGGIGRPRRKKASLDEYTADIEMFFQNCEEIAKSRANGNGHERPDETRWMNIHG